MADTSGRAADAVIHVIEDRIQTGALEDGQPLPPERDLMEEFGTSRTVVREAVRSLSDRGLVESRPRHRPVVRKPGYDTMLDTVSSIVSQLMSQSGGVKNLFDTRIMVEASLVRDAALKADKHDIDALKRALAANADAIEDSVLFYQTDMAFHEVLYEIPKNPVMPALHKAYNTWLAPQWSRMERLPDRNRENYEAHTQIFDAILMRDPDVAEAALRAHLEDAWTQVKETFGDI